MISKYYYYEFRPATEKDLFSDLASIGMASIIKVVIKGDAKVSFVCNHGHPWLGEMPKIFKLYHKCKSKLLLISKKRGY